jgi:hypothetical protein
MVVILTTFGFFGKSVKAPFSHARREKVVARATGEAPFPRNAPQFDEAITRIQIVAEHGIAAHLAQESSRQDHTAAPLPDDRGTHVRGTTRIAIKRVQNSSAARVKRSNVAVCSASVCA